jgi:hypothetical protein
VLRGYLPDRDWESIPTENDAHFFLETYTSTEPESFIFFLALHARAPHGRRRARLRRGTACCARQTYLAGICHSSPMTGERFHAVGTASTPNAALKQILVSGGRAGFKPRHKDVARCAFLLALSAGEGCAASLAACSLVAEFDSKAQIFKARGIANLHDETTVG